jgi:hypothetical protein
MEWSALVGATVGAILALSGSLVMDVRRDRQARRRDRQTSRRTSAVELILALNAALGALRDVAAQPSADHDDQALSAARAVGDAGLHAAREHVLITGTPALIAKAEETFRRLIAVRDAVRSGSSLESPVFHDAYHSYADSLWRFRLSVRDDLGEGGLTPADLLRRDWSDREQCQICASAGFPAG